MNLICWLRLHFWKTASAKVTLLGNHVKLQYCAFCPKTRIMMNLWVGSIVYRVQPDDTDALEAIAAHRQGSAQS